MHTDIVAFVIVLVNYRHLLDIISSDIKLTLHVLLSDLHIKEFQVVNVMLHFECDLPLASSSSFSSSFSSSLFFFLFFSFYAFFPRNLLSPRLALLTNLPFDVFSEKNRQGGKLDGLLQHLR